MMSRNLLPTEFNFEKAFLAANRLDANPGLRAASPPGPW